MSSKWGRWWGMVLLPALGAFGTLAVAQERVAVDSQNAPFMFAEGGEAAGLYPVLLKAAFARMGVALQVQAMPWSRALAALDQGEVGVGGIYKNSERMQKYDYSAPIFVEKLVLYVRRDRPMTYATMQDLDGKRVGVIRGWSYGDAFDAARRAGRVEIEEVAGDAQNFSKLESRRLDAVIAVDEAGQALLGTGAYPSVVALATPLAINATYLAFHKSAARRALIERFDRTLEAMRRTGEHERLVRASLQPAAR